MLDCFYLPDPERDLSRVFPIHEVVEIQTLYRVDRGKHVVTRVGRSPWPPREDQATDRGGL